MITLLALNNFQKAGIATAVLLVLGWLAYLAGYLRKEDTPPPGAEMELAPNRRPYFDDEGLEGPRLDRALLWGLVLMVVTAVGLPLYWAREPSRQDGAVRGFDNRAAGRGLVLFQPAGSPIPEGNIGHFGCGGCHGAQGQGGVANYVLADPLDPEKPPREVLWAAPPLDTVLLRYSEDELKSVLVYGRANTPMPAWGIEGGGPMNDQQITDLIAYIETIQREPEEVKEQNLREFGTDGAKLFDGFCARCHTEGWSIGEPGVPGGGAYGPSLTGGATLRQFPDPDLHVEFIAEGAEYAEPYGIRGLGGDEGGGMPGFGQMLTTEQIEAIVEYERGL